MLIAIDYDDTFTRDPHGWREVMRIMRARGHEFVCVTGRCSPPEPHEPVIPCEIVCTDGAPKRAAAQHRGFMVDVWIDDVPELIGKSARAFTQDEGEPE